MNPQRDFLTARYAQLWDRAIDFIRNGKVTIDPLLASRDLDRRRCLAVLARPSTEIQQAVNIFLNQLRQIDSEQYYYEQAELHVTVLSLFTATEEYEKYLIHYDQYLEAVNAALTGTPPFEIEFIGVTATKDAIMIQGFLNSTALNDARERLRKELRTRNLTTGLDSRYVLQTAHMTVVRFRSALQNSQAYSALLEDYRSRPFGNTQVKELNLVRNDWCMSNLSVELLQKYPLG